MNSNNLDKNNLLNLYKEKNYNSFIKSGLKLLKKNPKNYQLTYLIGLSYVNLQKYAEAEKYFDKLLYVQKKPEIFFIQANIHKQLKKYDSAISYFEEAIQLNPNFSEAYNNLGNTKKRIGKIDEAIFCFEKAIQLKENNIQAYLNLANIYKENKKFNKLIKIYEKILSFNQNDLKTLYNLGSAYLFLGNISKGKYYFEKIIKINSNHIPSYRNYISVTKITKKNEIFKKLELLSEDIFSDDDKILFYDALSKGYFDQDNDELAFKYLEKSNSLKKKNSKFSFKKAEIEFKDTKTFFEKIDNIDINYKDTLKSRPIFIIGMPRSGTTLIEQILSSHSQIYGAGELDFLPKIIDKLGIKKPTSLESFFTEMRNSYYDQIKKISDDNYIIDKLPANYKWVGFIINAFPESKIIHIERNPMAVCWSNYKTSFVDSGMDFNLTQQDIAKYYSLYLDTINFWKSKYAKNIFDVNYENFVNDFETNSREILNFLDLKWEDEIKNYNKNMRPVTTASFQQVREGIKKNTSLSWKKYSNYLMPMQETLNNMNIKF
jgi:tetratricopeptide (TPR) repeat protein